MREIKFRVWDSKKKEMLEMFSDDTGPGFLMDFFCNAYEASNGDNVILMQFTGLKDKNTGQEIYEGDIVEVDTTGINYRGEKVLGDVRFIDGCFTVEFTREVEDPISGLRRGGKSWRKRLYLKCFTVNYAVKVLGNIHENPELLNTECK